MNEIQSLFQNQVAIPFGPQFFIHLIVWFLPGSRAIITSSRLIFDKEEECVVMKRQRERERERQSGGSWCQMAENMTNLHSSPCQSFPQRPGR